MRLRPFLLVSMWWLLANGSLACDPGGGLGQSQTVNLPSCPQAQCTSGAHFAFDLAATAADAPNLELKLCRNELCSTLRPTADGTEFACDFAGPITAACRISKTAGGLHLELTFLGVMTSWAVGDIFSVRVGLPQMASLVDEHRIVDAIVVTYPAGPECRPECRSPTLRLLM